MTNGLNTGEWLKAKDVMLEHLFTMKVLEMNAAKTFNSISKIKLTILNRAKHLAKYIPIQIQYVFAFGVHLSLNLSNK